MRFALPDLGEGLHEAEIIAWHVGAGDHVVADQPLVSVETDKAIVDVPSPRAGRIARCVGAPGDVIEVGATLVEFEDEASADTGTVVGQIAPCAPESRRSTSSRTGDAMAGSAGGEGRAARALASPAVRRRARELGVDLTRIAPREGGPAPSIADVEAAVAQGDGWERLRGPRRAMARRMERSRDAVAAATVHDDADVGDWPDGTRVMVRLVRALAEACRVEPALNAWYDAARDARFVHLRLDLGIAVDTGDGLLVPVLRDAGGLDADATEAAIGSLRTGAEGRSLSPEDMLGASFTVSNFGPLGGRHAVLVVVPPQVAILGAGAITPEVRVRDGAPAVRNTLPLSLSFDHRAVTGGEAARFLAAVVADLEGP